MKTWTIWLVSIAASLILFAVFIGSSLWNNLQSEWQVERAAAQFALNHSPLTTITAHDVFTADGAEEVFLGKDSFGRPWYVTVFGTPFEVKSIAAQSVRPKNEIIQEASQQGLKVLSTHIGCLTTTAREQMATNANFVWEVYGETQTGSYQYAYYDAQSGKFIQSY
jgi:uncharacterized protein YpmB